MPPKTGRGAKGKGADGKSTVGGDGKGALLPQEWNSFVDHDTEKRREDLARIEKFVREVHGQSTTDGLHSALLALRALDASMPTSLCEVSFSIALGNEVGLDKIRKDPEPHRVNPNPKH
jgi:hypothetical protein